MSLRVEVTVYVLMAAGGGADVGYRLVQEGSDQRAAALVPTTPCEVLSSATTWRPLSLTVSNDCTGSTGAAG